MKNKLIISLHGGHSGEFCSHAKDHLEDIVLKYIGLGFTKVGITEHIPPAHEDFLYPDERRLGLTVPDLDKRFEAYFQKLRSLQKQYASKIRIFAGMETETYAGYAAHIKTLISRFNPDYIVGSVHHVNDICFDYSREDYERVVALCGSYELMYEKYFDLQQDMILTLKPFVVAHFDLVRIFDPDYEKRLLIPSIREKIIRNLELIKSLNLVLDFNLRPLKRGEKEPYITGSIRKTAKEMGILVVPGDDSHGAGEAGGHVERAVNILTAEGFSTDWPDPVLVN
ncbi:MAG: histidinol-phosphatase [Desulfobacula sp.]|jgi:histidinol-phosphatase (PHP family)